MKPNFGIIEYEDGLFAIVGRHPRTDAMVVYQDIDNNANCVKFTSREDAQTYLDANFADMEV